MPRRKRALICLVTVIAVLAITGVLMALSFRASVNSQIRHIPNALPSASAPIPIPSESRGGGSQSGEETDQVPPAIGTPINILVLGSDSRVSGGDPTDWHYGGQRSDVTMIIQVTGDRRGLNVMSIPRDSWVPIPGFDTAKINAAFSYGGAPLAIQTVTNLTGIHIDHIVIVDFASFEHMTDQLGGVTIQTADGPVEMSGSEALTFVRERYSLPGGDFDRVRRQQAWIKAIMTRVMERDVLISPTQVTALTQVLLEHSAVDEGLTVDTIVPLALSMRNLRPAGANFLTAPVVGTSWSDDGQSIVLLDEALLAELSAAWRQDRVAAFLEATPQIVTLDSNPVN